MPFFNIQKQLKKAHLYNVFQVQLDWQYEGLFSQSIHQCHRDHCPKKGHIYISLHSFIVCVTYKSETNKWLKTAPYKIKNTLKSGNKRWRLPTKRRGNVILHITVYNFKVSKGQIWKTVTGLIWFLPLRVTDIPVFCVWTLWHPLHDPTPRRPLTVLQFHSSTA